MNLFLNRAEEGKNNGWRYLVSMGIILFFGIIVGAIPAVINEITKTTNMELKFIGSMFSFITFILGMWIAIRGIHKRNFITLITTQSKVNWKRYFYGFGMTILVLSLLSVVDYVFHSNDYQFVFTEWSLGQFATMLLLSIMLIPIQTAAEEIFFRGYLLQGFGRKIKNPYILSFVIGVLFTLPHLGNPEVAKGLLPAAIGYFIYGFLFSLITLWSNGLELAMGIHCANNLFIAVGIGMTDSALTTRPIYLINEWDIWNSVFLEVVLCILLYFIMIRYIRKNEIE